MTNAIRDNNHTPVLMGVLYTDGTTLVPIAIDGSGLMVTNETDTIGFTPDVDAIRDENHVTVMMGVDSTDSTKLCPVFVDATGAVLVGSS